MSLKDINLLHVLFTQNILRASVIVVGSVFIGVYFFITKFNKSESSHGTANWLSSFQKKKIVNKNNDGYVINGIERISHTLSTKNILTVAPTGAGKTWGQIIPNIIRQGEYSIVCTDPSGEVFKQTSGGLQKEGVNIIVFQPFNPSQTMFFNPIQHVQNLSDAKVVANTIMAQDSYSAADKFWTHAPAMVISALINLLLDMSKLTGINKMNLSNVLALASLNFDDLNALFESMGSLESKNEFTIYRESAPATRGSILASLLASASLFSDPIIKQTTSSNSIDFSELRTKKTVAYLIIPEDKIIYSKPLMALFYKHLFSHLFKETQGYPVYLLLDEFGNMKIPDFETIVTQSRKKNISISIMLQSLDQLKAQYKESANTILEGGCQTKIFYSAMGLSSCKMVSETIGDKTEFYESRDSKNPGNKERKSRRLIMPEEIRTMPSNQIIVLTENRSPMKLDITQGYNQKEAKDFFEFSRQNPAVISTNITPVLTYPL